MSTRATVYIHGNDGEMDIKLYHHWDGYVENLGVKLEKALENWRKNLNRSMKTGRFGSNKTLIQCIANVGGFELAWPIHGDVEYIYHVRYGINGKKAWYDLRGQSGHCYGEENLLASPKVLLCSNGDLKKKKLNWKQAEKDLGNEFKFIAGYLD